MQTLVQDIQLRDRLLGRVSAAGVADAGDWYWREHRDLHPRPWSLAQVSACKQSIPALQAGRRI